MRQRRKTEAPRPLPTVWGTATIEVGGVRLNKAVTVFEKLPGWWARSTEDQRLTWLREYFRRALKLAPEDTLIGVTVGGTP